jgi:hypothetical protein
MKRACPLNTNKDENQIASSIRPIKSNYLRMKYSMIMMVTIGLLLFSCVNSSKIIVVKNTLDIDRLNETVSLSMHQLGIKRVDEFNRIGIVDAETNEKIIFQKIDTDNDSINDLIIFQPAVKSLKERKFKLVTIKNEPETESKIFSRFVPERTDDYAWENDKVAFRTYGPTAQKMVEDNVQGGTLSSGLDCWLKKVNYPIINKWYEKTTSGEGSYHQDTGEGLDNFHVGESRGCGGIGVYLNDTLYASKNFTDYKTYLKGPLRLSFSLTYADWKAKNLTVSEQKTISIDLGSNLMDVVVKIKGTETLTAGLTLHENDGVTKVDTISGFFSYWQPHEDSELGTAIIISPEYYNGFTKVESGIKDASQLLVHLKVIEGQVKYKTGFGWKKSGQFNSQTDWEDYLKNVTKAMKEPLLVDVINK